MAGRKEYELLFQLKAQAGNFSRVFKGEQATLRSLKSEMLLLNNAAQKVKGFKAQTEALQKSKEKARLLSEQYGKLKMQMQQTEQPSAALQNQFARTEAQLNTTNAKIKEQEEALKGLGQELRQAGINTDNLDQETQQLQASYDRLAKTQRTLTQLSEAQEANKKAISDTKRELLKTGAAVVAAGTAAYKAFVSPAANFESQMSTVKAISNASAQDIKMLSAEAKKMGATTKFTAVESGQALEYMAMAGWDVKEQISGLPGVIHLAAAANEDLAPVSDIVTDSMTAFKMEATESKRFSDVLAAAATVSNTNVGFMGRTFQEVAPLAGALNYSVEDMAVAVGLMANSGIKGSKSGTQLRNVISNLADPTNEVKQAMQDLDISIANADGTAKPFAEVVRQLRTGFAELNETERTAYASMIGGKEAMAGVLAIVNSSEDDFAKLTNEINNCNGAAQRMAKTRLDNFRGDVTLMKSAWDGLSMAIGENFLPNLRQGVQGVTAFFTRAQRWVAQNGDLLKSLVKIGAALAGLKIGGLALKLVTQQITKGSINLYRTFTTLTGSIQTLKDKKGMKGLVKQFGGTEKAIAKFIPAAAAAAVVLVAIGTAIYAAWQQAKQAELDKRFGEIKLSLEEMDAIAAQLVGGKQLQQAAAALDAFGNLDGISDSMRTARGEFEKLNWQVGIGINLTETEQESYKSAVDDYVANMQTYITDQGYAVNIGLTALFGENSKALESIGGTVSSVTESLSGELTSLGEELSVYVATAFEDGIFDIDEQKAAAELQKKMAEIQAIVTQSEYQAKLDMLQMEYSGASLDASTYKELQAELNKVAEESAENTKATVEKTLAGLHTSVNSAQWLYDNADSGAEKRDALIELQAAQRAYDKFKSQDFGELMTQPYVEAATFALNTIETTYPEFAALLQEMRVAAGETYAELSASGQLTEQEIALGLLDSLSEQKKAYGGMDATTRATLSACMGYIADNISAIDDQIAAYQRAGEAIPEEIAKIQAAYYGYSTLSSSGTLSWGQKRTVTNVKPVIQYGKSTTVQGNATGSSNTAEVFLAGERGPELITNAPGRVVFTASETAAILRRQEDLKSLMLYMNSSVPSRTTPGIQAPSLMAPSGNSAVVHLVSNPIINVQNGDPEEIKRVLREHDEELVNLVEERLSDKADTARRRAY